MKHIAKAHDVHREDAMFIKATERAKRDDRLAWRAEHSAQRPVNIDIGDVAQVLPCRIAGSSRKVDSHAIVEDKRLRRLRERHAPIRQGVVLRLKQQTELLPSHDNSPSSAATPNP